MAKIDNGNTTEALKKRWPHGPAFIEQMREKIGPKCIVAFSSGKDAVAMSVAMKPHFEELIPFCCYYVPGLKIMDEALDYYETELFGGPIIRMPHPVLISWLAQLRYQTPESAKRVVAANLPSSITFPGIVAEIEKTHGIEPKTLYAVGARSGEFFSRAIQVKNHGGVWAASQQWWPVWEKTRQEVLDTISGAGLKLSREYDLFQTSFCGLDYGFMERIKRFEPEDWDAITRTFPLIDAELQRFDRQSDSEKRASASRTRAQDAANTVKTVGPARAENSAND